MEASCRASCGDPCLRAMGLIGPSLSRYIQVTSGPSGLHHNTPPGAQAEGHPRSPTAFPDMAAPHPHPQENIWNGLLTEVRLILGSLTVSLGKCFYNLPFKREPFVVGRLRRPCLGCWARHHRHLIECHGQCRGQGWGESSVSLAGSCPSH